MQPFGPDADVSSVDDQAGIATDVLPVFDLEPFLRATANGGDAALNPGVLELCTQLADCLRGTGCLVVRDPRVAAADNDVFLDTMEAYFGQPDEVKLRDARPHLHYQVGATPVGVEVPRCLVDPGCSDIIAAQPQGHKATLPRGPDQKWRFMWRLGPRPAHTAYAELNADPVVPAGFPQWSDVMDGWGGKMLAAVEVVAQMAALGLGLPADAITSLMSMGPHLLAPTGADLSRAQPDTVLAGFHYDLNLMTIHGKCRFPGLSVWLRDGRRAAVAVPPGCLLLQAGKQLEWLTGGAVRAGMHEVLATPAAVGAGAAAEAAGRSPWRVSSTVFAHVASDCTLRPLGPLATPEALDAYPALAAGEQVQQELEVINLKQAPSAAAAAVQS